MLNALRLNEGFSTDDYEARTGQAFDGLRDQICAAERRGLMTATERGWRPTDLGLRFLNDLQGSFLA